MSEAIEFLGWSISAGMTLYAQWTVGAVQVLRSRVEASRLFKW